MQPIIPYLAYEDAPAALIFLRNAFGFEEVNGVSKHGIAHYLDMAASGQVDLTGMLTHTFVLDEWRDAWGVLINQETTGAIKVAFDFRE